MSHQLGSTKLWVMEGLAGGIFKSSDQLFMTQPSEHPKVHPISMLCFTFFQVPHDLDMTQGPSMKKIVRAPITSSITSLSRTYKAESLQMNKESGSWAQQSSLQMWMNSCDILSNPGQRSSVFLPLAWVSHMPPWQVGSFALSCRQANIYNSQTKKNTKDSK